MKKLFYLIPIIILLTGCNSYIELNNLGIINKIGLTHNDNYQLYASIINNINENLEPKEDVITVEGDDILELINNLSTSLNKKIYMSHLDLLIIDDTIKTYEIKNLLNYFLNNNETRENFLVVSTNDVKKLINNSKFQEINNLIKINQNETSKSLNTTMFDIAKNYYLNKEIYIQNINYNDKLYLDGITKIRNNKVEHIENNKSIFINYLLNNINSYKENIVCKNNQSIYLEILESYTNTFTNKLIITNEIKVITNDCNLDKKSINKLFSNYLKKNISLYTNKDIIINNTIRSIYENN
ncbi:MAG: hypothetical protein IKN63_05180 [Bacilli bacterium]|nr:hypothetical protein [Bacilli bacterium]